MLYAKSGTPPYPLREHSLEVLNVLRKLRQIWPSISTILDRAALFHDFGKASEGFQAALLGNGNQWRFRHEVLSAAIFRDCYDLSQEDVFQSYLALLAHHKNLGSNTEIADAFQSSQSMTPVSRWYHKWRELRYQELKETFSEELANWEYNPAVASPANEVGSFIRRIKPAFNDLNQVIMRGTLVAADHLASSRLSGPLEGKNITAESLESFAEQHIKGWSGWSYIQQRAVESNANGSTLLIAPTGAGKTEAAILWALRNRTGGERIFYVLPYRVSINSMAERISKMFPADDGSTTLHKNDNISILHSNTSLAYLQNALNDEIEIQKAIRIADANRNAARKIYSPIKITTVYQLLNFFFGQKFFEVGLLELTNSIIIFDEIHAYDGHTIGLILVMLEYLRRLNARFFIMTATLPTKLKEQLREAASIPVTQEISLRSSDPLLREVRRKLKMHDSLIENNIDLIKKTIELSLKQGEEVVIVCNTVPKAIRIWEQLKIYDPLLIHSRFTLRDRNKREGKENIEKRNVVVSTQVIEVSLDVSFKVMFTELAPVDSLLQRFGRVNRHGPIDLNNLGECHVFTANDKGSTKIYDPEILDLTKNYMPDVQLNFDSACNWIERVYPNGLSEKGNDEKEKVRSIFRELVAQLKPMIDPPVNLDLEKSLISTIEVVPLSFEADWRQLKESGEHLLAQGSLVNVSYQSWSGALRKYKNEFADNGFRSDRTTDQYKTYIIARFEYDSDTGLRLDKPIPPIEDSYNFIF